jgi:hypothetical protein
MTQRILALLFAAALASLGCERDEEPMVGEPEPSTGAEVEEGEPAPAPDDDFDDDDGMGMDESY